MLWLPIDNITIGTARPPMGGYTYSLRHERSGQEVLGKYLGN